MGKKAKFGQTVRGTILGRVSMATPSSPGRDTSSTGFSVSPKDGASFISNETMMTNRSLKELLRMAMKKKWGSTVAAWRGLLTLMPKVTSDLDNSSLLASM